MKWIDELTNFQKVVAAFIFFFGVMGSAIAWLPTPIHTDVEAEQLWAASKSAGNCETIYRLELQILALEEEEANPEVPQWRKNQIARQLPKLRKTLELLRQQNPECLQLI